MTAKSKLKANFRKNRNSDYSSELRNELIMLRQAVDRSRKIFRPEKDSTLCHRPGSIRHVFDFRIGTIAKKISYDELFGGKKELHGYSPELKVGRTKFPAYYRMLAPQSLDAIEEWRAGLLAEIEGLIKGQSANLVCVSELGFPPARAISESGISTSHIKRLEEGNSELISSLQTLADEYEAFIVGGSFHDNTDLTNKAIIFGPHCSEPKEHIKLTSAKSPRIGEVVRTPPHPNFTVYDSIFGLVGVLICLDAYDLNMLCRYISAGLVNRVEDLPSVIFVPAYSPRCLGSACKDLSYFSRSTVVYVNGEASPFCKIFVAGEEVYSEKDERISHFEVDFDLRDSFITKAFEKQEKGLFGIL